MIARRASRYVTFVVLAITGIVLYQIFQGFYKDDHVFRQYSPRPPQTIHFRPSSFDWASVKEHFPLESPITPLPHDAPKILRKVQYEFQSKADNRVAQ